MAGELRSATFTIKMDVAGKEKTKELVLAVNDLDEATEKLNQEFGEQVTVTGKVTKSQKEVTRQTRLTIAEANRQAKQFKIVEKQLQDQIRLYGMDAKAAAVYNAQVKAGVSASSAQGKAIEQLVMKQQQLEKSNSNLQGSMRNTRGVAQNLGWQLQDVAVQAQMGTNGLIIMTQQGSQMLSSFGAKGALAGAGLAVFGAMAMALSPSLKQASKSVKEMADEMKAYADATEVATGATREWQLIQTGKNINSLTNQYQTLSKYLAQVEYRQRAMTDAFENGAVFDADQQAYFNTEILNTKKAIEEVEKALKQAGKATSTLGGDPSDDFARMHKQFLDDRVKWQENAESMRRDMNRQTYLEERKEHEKAIKAKENAESMRRDMNRQTYLEERKEHEKAIKAKEKADIDYVNDTSTWDRQASAYYAKVADAQVKDDAKRERELLAEKERLNGEYLQRKKQAINAEAELYKGDQDYQLDMLEQRYKKELKLFDEFGGDKAALTQKYQDEVNYIKSEGLERWVLDTEKALGNTEKLTEDALDTFTSGFGDAFADAIMGAESFGDAMKGTFEAMATSMISYFAEWAAQKVLLWALDQTLTKSSQLAAAETLTANAQSQSLLAGINAYQSAAAIPYVGWAIAPAASAAAIATTEPMAVAASSFAFAGAFDEGGVIPSGSAGIVSEYHDELVGGTMVYNNSGSGLNVTGSKDTAALMSGGNTTNNTVNVNSSGNASPAAIARAVDRSLRRKNKRTDNNVYESMNRGRKNKGAKFNA